MQVVIMQGIMHPRNHHDSFKAFLFVLGFIRTDLKLPYSIWQIDEETMETVIDLIFLGSKITADGDCRHEIKICLLLKRKTMTNLDSILKKQRHHFASKGSYSQIYDFSSRELDYKEG